MKALILNSGLGSRMGVITAEQPKCMTDISSNETILGRQLRQLVSFGIDDVVITTGKFSDELVAYVQGLNLALNITFVHNAEYANTNYIYSMFLAREQLDDDILLMHGDLVFEDMVLEQLLITGENAVIVSSTVDLPQKDFKAVIKDGLVEKIGIEFFADALASQPLYYFSRDSWLLWMQKIEQYCSAGERSCYAEKALNDVLNNISLRAVDIRRMLCNEIDTPDDLAVIRERLREIERLSVYICFASEVIHSGHIALIKRAQRLGKVTIGVLSDKAVASYKRVPLLPYEERKALFENVVGVHRVVRQDTLSYRENLERYRPDYVVHGDDWQTGFQKPIRDEVVSCIASYGGQLVEYPYAADDKYKDIEQRMRADLSLPEVRAAALRRAIEVKRLVTAIEAHSGLTGLLAENTVVYQDGAARQFDAMWISSLCDSTAKGKPDIELVDMTSRFRTIDDIMEVTTKPIIFDGDTGGLREHFVYTVRTLERMGVSMIIIEDKTGLKKNSLFGTEVEQTQDSIESFCEKIAAGKKAQKGPHFMICARIESLILERGMADALERAFAFVAAGADAIMIHSRQKDPAEIFEFVEVFRAADSNTPIVVVPTSFNMVTEEEFQRRGVNVVIYANQLTRTGFPAMQNAARLILEHHRAKECDDICMPIKDIISLIPEDV